MTTILYIVIAIVLIGFLILVHETGHYTAARLLGVPVHEFAIGFGKRIVSWNRKGIAYSLRVFPVGGYVMFADPKDESGIAKFYAVPVWKRFITTISGPLMNFLAAFLALYIYAVSGWATPTIIPAVGSIVADSPAAQAGLNVNDRFLSVNGVQIGDNVNLIASSFNEAAGKPVDVTIDRNGEKVSAVITAKYNDQQNRYMIGITLKQAPVPIGLGKAVSVSGSSMVYMVKTLLDFLGNLFFHGQGGDQVSGPIGVVTDMTTTAQQYGWTSFIEMAIFISVNLGLFNLLPIPGLDGSKVIFQAVEWVRGKPVSPEKEGVITMIGFALLLVLFLFLTYRDLGKLFGWIQK